MQKNIFIIGFIVVLLVAVSLLTMYDFDKKENVDLDDRARLLSYSYFVLDDYFSDYEKEFDMDLKLDSFDFDYHKLFITLICDGNIRGCQSGSSSAKGFDRFFEDTKEATIECIEDDRFGGELEELEKEDVDIVFTFLFEKEKLKSNDYDYIKDNIELGIHGIEVEGEDGNSAYFKESVPISHNYDLEYTLERLCKKAGLSDDAWMDDSTSIYKYDTMSFIGDRENNIFDLYRYNILIDVDDITNDDVLESISLGRNWFLNNIDTDTGLLEYKYYPSSDSYSSSNNDVRQIASLWSMTEIDVFFDNTDFEELVNTTIDYYLSYKENIDNYSYLTIDGYSKLAYNAFMILVLVNTPYYENRDILLSEFSQGILSLQNDDGSYNTYFNSDRNSGVDFYPGEAMLALMKLYNYNGNSSYLESVKKAAPYYIDYWRSNKNSAFIPWHTQTYYFLYQETKDYDLVDFVFEMNDWVINYYQNKTGKYPDKIGGFPKSVPRYSTSSYLEGINDAYSLAVQVNADEKIAEYKESIRLGTRFILQTQFNEKNIFYLENPKRAIGGFKESLVSNDLRNDYTQHAVMALIKTYNNDIFD